MGKRPQRMRPLARHHRHVRAAPQAIRRHQQRRRVGHQNPAPAADVILQQPSARPRESHTREDAHHHISREQIPAPVRPVVLLVNAREQRRRPRHAHESTQAPGHKDHRLMLHRQRPQQHRQRGHNKQHRRRPPGSPRAARRPRQHQRRQQQPHTAAGLEHGFHPRPAIEPPLGYQNQKRRPRCLQHPHSHRPPPLQAEGQAFTFFDGHGQGADRAAAGGWLPPSSRPHICKAKPPPADRGVALRPGLRHKLCPCTAVSASSSPAHC